MRIISFCADGIEDAAANGFFEWLEDQDADIVCIQNLKTREYKLTEDKYFPAGYNPYFFEAAEENSNGVAIYCRQIPKAIMTGLGFNEFDMEGRYIQADYGDISIASLLAPTAYPSDSAAQARKTQFFDLYYAHLNKVRNKRREFIICGNWNIAPRNIDVGDAAAAQGMSGCLAEEQQWMDSLQRELGYVDAFRQYNNDADEFTWWPEGNQTGNGWRVDLQIVSSRLKPTIEYGAIYKKQNFSSHAPLIIDYDIELPETVF